VCGSKRIDAIIGQSKVRAQLASVHVGRQAAGQMHSGGSEGYIYSSALSAASLCTVRARARERRLMMSETAKRRENKHARSNATNDCTTKQPYRGARACKKVYYIDLAHTIYIYSSMHMHVLLCYSESGEGACTRTPNVRRPYLWQHTVLSTAVRLRLLRTY
jgi:hypothetical protein